MAAVKSTGTRYAGSVNGQISLPVELREKYAKLRASTPAHVLRVLLGGVGIATLDKLDRGGVACPDSVRRIVDALRKMEG